MPFNNEDNIMTPALKINEQVDYLKNEHNFADSLLRVYKYIANEITELCKNSSDPFECELNLIKFDRIFF
ncbi:MAG: hypothetical protein HKM04_01105 [Legionellales bacterium]|nr:hypothetical protein [Legionellales bacterium]